MPKLLISNFDYADEFDVKGWETMGDEEYANWLAVIPENFEVSFSVGSNEDIEMTSRKEYLRGIKVKDITEEERATLQKLFSYSERGKFLDIGEYL